MIDKAIHIDTKHQAFWLSYEWLLKHNVSENTISQWSKRNVCRYKHIDGRAFINYDTIPEPTRKKLPTKEQIKAEYKRARRSNYENAFYNWLIEAQQSPRMIHWRNEILQQYKVTPEKATEFARRAAVFERAVEIRKDFRWAGNLTALFDAYCRVYPGNFNHLPRFHMTMTRAHEEGILSVAVDGRSQKVYEGKYKEDHQYRAMYILSHNKGFDLPMAYEIFAEACCTDNEDTPSFGWFKKYYFDNKNIIERNRLGESAWQQKHGSYAKLIQALNAGDQWQADGWDIPIYGKKINKDGKLEKFVRFVLYAVIDSHSRKIIGYRITESEDRETILQALELAVKHTGMLPYEFITDNHSANKTKVIEYLKDKTDKLGMTWNVDSNPRRKVLIERMFKTLGSKHFKKHYGYIGQGIKSKEKDGRTQQELMDLYTKNSTKFLTYEQIVLVTNSVIEEYNHRVLKSLGASPAARYEKSEQPNAIRIDDFARISLFNRQSEYKISRGQITIKHGMHTYEYQLPAEYSVRYNGKTVGVRYADFEEIYLYDKDTDTPICSITQKTEIYAALANQTEKDTEQLYKNSGRIKGINSKMRTRKEALVESAVVINPNAVDTLNRKTTPKDLFKELNQQKHLRDRALEQGVVPEKVATLPKVDEMLDSSMKPKLKENKSPFAPKKPIEIGKITIGE